MISTSTRWAGCQLQTHYGGKLVLRVPSQAMRHMQAQNQALRLGNCVQILQTRERVLASCSSVSLSAAFAASFAHVPREGQSSRRKQKSHHLSPRGTVWKGMARQEGLLREEVCMCAASRRDCSHLLASLCFSAACLFVRVDTLSQREAGTQSHRRSTDRGPREQPPQRTLSMQHRGGGCRRHTQ